jgi:hypothetical protein
MGNRADSTVVCLCMVEADEYRWSVIRRSDAECRGMGSVKLGQTCLSANWINIDSLCLSISRHFVP